MQTVSINICTLCTQCFNRCRYCLLSYDGKVQGADWERSCLYDQWKFIAQTGLAVHDMNDERQHFSRRF